MKKIILASTSPRRKALLRMVEIPFISVASNYQEKMETKLTGDRLAERLSLGKALAVSFKYPKSVVVAFDTFVICEGEFLGKARTSREAKKMLDKISGKKHEVVTGFTLIDGLHRQTVTKSVKSGVWIKKLRRIEISEYVKSGEPIGKAGAYAIQGLGSLIVEKIEGDYFNIVGLPLVALVEELGKIGIDYHFPS